MKKRYLVFLFFTVFLFFSAPVLGLDFRTDYLKFLVLPNALNPMDPELFMQTHWKNLMTPASYDIIDTDNEKEQYCRQFVADAVSLTYPNRRYQGLPNDFEVTFHAKSADYCQLVQDNVSFEYCQSAPYGIGCECEGFPDGTEVCKAKRQKPYTLILARNRDSLTVRGAEHSMIAIGRRRMERLSYVWGDSSRMYNYQRVSTQGTFHPFFFPDGSEGYVYRTRFQNALSDLRGVSYVLTESQRDKKITKTFYEWPRHNKATTLWGETSYANCLEAHDPPFDFCFDRNGNDFLVASRFPLGPRLSFWVDPHFSR